MSIEDAGRVSEVATAEVGLLPDSNVVDLDVHSSDLQPSILDRIQADAWGGMVDLEAGFYGDGMLFNPMDWEAIATNLDLPSNF